MNVFRTAKPQRTSAGKNQKIYENKVLHDTRAQDLIEYALMAGFVAVAAGAIMPGVSTSISSIFSKVASVMTKSSGS
jgi:pilus assembly protein Flp/PilA